MNKRSIPPNFLTKADPGTVQYAFDNANVFMLLSIASNKRIVFFNLQCMHCHFMMRMQKKQNRCVLQSRKRRCGQS